MRVRFYNLFVNCMFVLCCVAVNTVLQLKFVLYFYFRFKAHRRKI